MNIIKYLKIIFFSTFIILVSTQSKSETKIAIVQMDNIIGQSLAGKSLIVQMKKLHENNKTYFNEAKIKLNLEKNKINSQKNVLSKEEYEKKVASLNKDFESYKNNGEKKIRLLESKRDKAMQKILNELNKILTQYSNENELSFIIDQKNIIIGKTNLNITNEIVKILDSKLKKVSLK